MNRSRRRRRRTQRLLRLRLPGARTPPGMRPACCSAHPVGAPRGSGFRTKTRGRHWFSAARGLHQASAPLLRHCCAIAAPSRRHRGAIAAPSLRHRCAFAALGSAVSKVRTCSWSVRACICSASNSVYLLSASCDTPAPQQSSGHVSHVTSPMHSADALRLLGETGNCQRPHHWLQQERTERLRSSAGACRAARRRRRARCLHAAVPGAELWVLGLAFWARLRRRTRQRLREQTLAV